MDLAPEDALRLNVLLANRPLAIRIDDSRLTLDGLLAGGETRIQLRPNQREDLYLQQVRSILSEKALGNPGRYPLYLQRWTRMGRMRAESLEQLLLIGEPSAVFAVVCAEGLTDELARRAWWAVEDAENARRMLETEAVRNGVTGPILARWLVEYLPFETETDKMIESVRAVLRPGLLPEAEREGLWRKAQRKQAYLVGFLAAVPDELPQTMPARPGNDTAGWDALAAANPVARVLVRARSAAGQSFLDTSLKVMQRPPTQDVVNALLDAIAGFFRELRPEGPPDQTIDELLVEAEAYLATPAAAACLELLPDAGGELRALRLLSGLGYGVVRPIFRESDAIGSLMRKKLDPVLGPVEAAMVGLLGR